MAKRYYWLKLKEDFFRQKEIKKLRRVAGGDTFTIIYLKIQLLSLKDEGKLFFDGVEETFYEEIALEIDEDIDNVKITLMFLLKNGLMEQIEEDEYLLPGTVEAILSEADSTRRSRESRAKKKALETSKTKALPSANLSDSGQETLHCNTNATKCNTDIDIEIDIDKKDRDRTTTITEEKKDDVVVVNNTYIFKLLKDNGFNVTPVLMDTVSEDIITYGCMWLVDAIKIACLNSTKNYKYIQSILKNWKEKGKDVKPQSKDKAKPKGNFDAFSCKHDYDFDAIEKKLLGWE